MNSDPAASYYFALLRKIVDEVITAGRQPVAAGLKPRLQALSNGDFSEARLGFPSFKYFLEAAEEAGVVELTRTPFDVVALPSKRSDSVVTDVEAGGASQPQTLNGKRIRPDLWRAWVEWSPSLKRFFELSSGRVVFLVDGRAEDEPQSLSSLRQQIAESPERYIPIAPISSETTVYAMRAFAASWDDSTEREAMLAALRPSVPEKAAVDFTRFLRVHNRIAAAWHLTRLAQVAESIDEWRRQHKVEVNYLIDIAPPSRKVVGHQRAATSLTEGDIRERIASAVQRMPLGDLLRLPIPAEYLFDI
jgi:hypothetical protein